MTDIFVRKCPFCGGHATVRWNVNKESFLAGCDNRDCPCLEMPMVNVDAWNRRPIEDLLRAGRKEVKESPTDHITAQWRQERQDDKSSNDTQKETGA